MNTSKPTDNPSNRTTLQPGKDALSDRPVADPLDAYCLRMEKAMSEGRVRYDDVRDYDACVRLKVFVTQWQRVHGPGAWPQKLPDELVIKLDKMLARWEAAAQANTKEEC